MLDKVDNQDELAEIYKDILNMIVKLDPKEFSIIIS